MRTNICGICEIRCKIIIRRTTKNAIKEVKGLKIIFGLTVLAMGLSFAASCSDPINQPPDNNNNNNGGETVNGIATQVEGLYEGVDTMSFDMLASVKPYTIPDSIATMSVTATGDRAVSVTWYDVLTHLQMGATFKATVDGTLTHITLTEDGDTVRFSNFIVEGNDTIVPDSVHANMGTPNNRSYAAAFTGAVSKSTHLGNFYIHTAFGATGNVYAAVA